MTLRTLRTPARLLLLTGLGLAIGAFFLFDLDRFLTFEALRQSREALIQLWTAHPVRTAAAFAGLYIAVTALSLPGAAILTLAAGMMFGLLWGTILVSFASTIGATLAFLSARLLLRDWVQRRFGARLGAVNAALERDGPFALFAFRLVPLLPFFVINLVMGLTRIRTLTFSGVSQIGMLPGTLVYVNAGVQLEALRSPADILSPTLIGSFTLLALFPFLARAGLNALRRRRVYAGWTRPKHYDRDLVVIGAGAGGLSSAYVAAALKAKVTLIEGRTMGGDCLNTGCVPSKALIRAAKAAREARGGARLGVMASDVRIDFTRVMDHVRGAIAGVAPHDSIERYTGLGVEVLQGWATLTSPWAVRIATSDGERTLTARSIILATGAQPTIPAIPGLEQVDCLTSETVWSLTERPDRLVILGGGPIGCELAQAFARLGAAVTVVERGARLLKREDPEVSTLIEAALRNDGVDVLTGYEARRCEGDQGNHSDKGAAGILTIKGSAGERRLPFDRLLCATGRTPRTAGYGLEALSIPLTARGAIAVNDHLQTRYPNIFAVGDVAGLHQLTHAAADQAWRATANALFGFVKKVKIDDRALPQCVFTDPEAARAGMNEQEAQARNIAYETTRYDLADLDRAIADGAAEGFIKVLTRPGTDRILGVTLVGAHAGEIMAEYALAMRHGLGLNKILSTVHAYPTFAEANRYAAGVWKRAHSPERLLRWLARLHAWRRG